MIVTVNLFQRKVVDSIPVDIACSLVSYGVSSLAPLFEGFLPGREFYPRLRAQ